jgi:hypothetical protein
VRIVVQPPLTAFIDDDAGYRAWLAANSGGFVLNTTRSPRADYLMLHRAGCRHISGDDTRSWTKNYAKVCGPSQALLDEWATSTVSCAADRCPFCLR